MDNKNKTKHTPGPWAYSVTEISGTSEPVITKCTINAQNETVVTLTGSQEANARLIAAAPELLAACIHARKMIDPKYKALITELGNVIAKATGAK